MSGMNLAKGEEPSPPPLPDKEEPPAPAPADNAPLDALQAHEVAPVNAVPPQEAGESEDDFAEEDMTPKYTVKEGPGGKITYVERPEASKLLLELLLDDKVTVLDSAIEAFQLDETVLVPLGKIAKLVDFPITVDTARGVASGWFVKKENTFVLESPYKTATVAGKVEDVSRGIAETHLDDIYVSLDLLSLWFPIKLTLNYNELRIYMKTLVPLPFQERAQRKSRWDALNRAAGMQPGLGYDPKDILRLPYRFYAAPSLQFTNGITHNVAPDGTTITGTSHAFNAQGDLLGMSGRASGSLQTSTDGREELSGLAFNLLKEDYAGSLLGPLKATRYELGDISTSTFPLAGQQTGRGASVTNEPYNFVRDATNFRIQGFGPVGWDVEVFQDSELLAYGPIMADGRYDFPSLPLGEGFNLFKIILYGPNGEKEERYERFYLGQNMVEAGKFLYNAALLQSSTPVLDVSSSPPSETPHTLSLLGEYGVTSYLSAMAGFYHGPIASTVLDGFGMGLRTSGGNTYAQVNAFFDKSGGQSTSALLTGNVTETISFNAQHTYHRGYDPGVYTTPKKTTVQMSKLFAFHNDIIPDINVTVGAEKETEDTGRVVDSLINRVSTNFMGLALSNELERNLFSDGTDDVFTGRFSGRLRAPFATVRADVNYEFHNPFRITSGTLTLEKDITEALRLTGGLSHTFGDTPVTTFTGAADWKLAKFRVGFAGSLDTTRNKQVGLTLTYNFVPRSVYGDYALSGATDDINSGRLVIRPFIDTNGDGVWQANEPLVQDAQFRNMLRGTQSEAVQGGLAVLPGLSPNLANPITVDDKSLLDLTLSPAKKQLLVLGKAGVNGPIDYPFTKSGGISGKVFRTGPDGDEQPLENVHIVLLGADGKEVTDAWTEYDGYFSFDDIPLGAYELFFAATAELSQYYKGDGDGPQLSIDFTKPDIADLKLMVGEDAITIVAPPQTKSENAPVLNSIPVPEGGEKTPENTREGSLPPRFPVFAMKLENPAN